ncbi:MAG TPA: histidine phosphatase family protein [Anaerolineaceae bacterium]|nr:histidine phosphatase family protein [Anaerolineaceae bacterium]
MTILYFVRHGETDSTGKKISGNLPGIHLNKRGEKQSTCIASFFETTAIRAIYCSPMERTSETATPLAVQKGLEIIKVTFLKEIDFGDFQGKGEELEQSSLWKRFLTTPARVHFPNGETVKEAQKRAVEGINQLCSQFSSAEEIVCVAHREVIRLAIAHVLKMPLDAYMTVTIDTGSISKVIWSGTSHKVIFLNHTPVISPDRLESK